MHANVYKLLPDAQLVATVDRNKAKANKFAKEFGVKAFTDFDEMIGKANPDIVDVCLPTYLHKEFTIKAARAKKHVICEKPIALNLKEADAMIEACEKAHVKFMIAHCIRFWPEYAKLKQIKESGELGCLLSVNLTRMGEFPSWSSENWLANEKLSGGAALDMHIHDSDYALYLLGEPKEIASFGTVDEHGPSFVFTTLSYPRAVAHLEGGWNLPKKTPFRMTFRAIFENGAVFWENGPMTIYPKSGKPKVVEFPKMKAEGGGNISDLGGYYLELKYFIERVRDKKPLEIVTPQSSRASLALVLKEIEQIKKHKK